jgi:GNAT superfamily N-acetyltransferase
MSFAIRILTSADWPQVERLFGPRGACGGCWCMHWRVEKGGKSWDAFKGAPAKGALSHLIAAGRVHAVLAFDHDEPVGWCCVGPREDFPRLERSRVLQRARGSGVWAVTCFFLDRRARHRGLGTRLLGEATALAFARGAGEVEGYPVRVKDGGELPAPFLWTGTPAMFARVGFARAAAADGAREIFVKGAA